MNNVNIIDAFEDSVTKDGAPLGDAFPALSRAAGLKVDHSLFSRWRNGKRTPPPAALRYMAQVVAPAILAKAGISTVFMSDEEVAAIALSFCPPPRND